LVHSKYVAVLILEECIHCGQCVERCVFDSRIIQGGKMEYDPLLCLGCPAISSTTHAAEHFIGFEDFLETIAAILTPPICVKD